MTELLKLKIDFYTARYNEFLKLAPEPDTAQIDEVILLEYQQFISTEGPRDFDAMSDRIYFKLTAEIFPSLREAAEKIAAEKAPELVALNAQISASLFLPGAEEEYYSKHVQNTIEFYKIFETLFNDKTSI